VLAFSVADPGRHVLTPVGPYALAGTAGCLGLFIVRERGAGQPMVDFGRFRDRSAYGGLLVSLLIGAALIAVLVDVPVFGRLAGRDQLGAALLLVRLLAAVPVGAAIGGLLGRALGDRLATASGALLAAAGLAAMTQWHYASAGSALETATLAIVGLGFGLTIAPINASVLDATDASVHGLAAALIVVARTVGMLLGLSVLTVIGLHQFHHATTKIASPLQLCPVQPTNCPAYDAAVKAAGLTEVHAVFAGAAACALAAAALAWLLRGRAAATRRPTSAAESTSAATITRDVRGPA
jgi:hypothetical protein